MTIGFSINLPIDQAKVETLHEMLQAGCNAVQINLGLPENIKYLDLLPDVLSKFNYRVLHLPKSNTTSNYDEFLEQLINSKVYSYFDSFILHPDGMKAYTESLRKLGSKLSIENMDDLKDFGQTVDNLTQVFEKLTEASWTFDVNHAYTVDPDMLLADQLISAFKTRLKQYHLSGYGDSNLPHTKLYQSGQDYLITKIRHNKPIIIESLGDADLSEFRRELDYIKQRLEITD